MQSIGEFFRLNCSFNYDYRLVPGSHNAHYYADAIRVLGERLSYPKTVRVDSTKSYRIRWENPDEGYKGKYLVIIQDPLEAYIGLIETKESEAYIELEDYGDHRFLIYTIRAEDCRSSDMHALVIKGKAP